MADLYFDLYDMIVAFIGGATAAFWLDYLIDRWEGRNG